MNNINVLIACEESQAVCTAFRDLGLNAFSCDIQECSGGHPEWHIKGDVLKVLNPLKQSLLMTGTPTGVTKENSIIKEWTGITFQTMDGKWHNIDGKWDLIIAFPPCTDLAVSGARHFEQKRKDGRQKQSIEFFCEFLKADCERIVIENPIGIISGSYIQEHFPEIAVKYNLPIKPSQIVQPWEYGHGETKATCLWEMGVPNLTPTDIVEGREQRIWRMPPSPDRAKLRSKTFPGIAKAMAEQWGKYVWYQKYGGKL